MNSDDLVYLSFLIFSIFFGWYYRQIKHPNNKQLIGAVVGICITFAVSNLHLIHLAITIAVNGAIILCFNRHYCHLLSFLFSFVYLIFFRSTTYFGIPYPPNHTNLIQMILTLKLVGLAFEVNSCHAQVEKSKFDCHWVENLSFYDIVCYSFNYIGVLTGPYYKYRTFVDHLNKPFSKYDDYKLAAIKNAAPLIPFSIIYLLTDYYWPLSFTQTDDFAASNFWSRYWYIWPTFLNLRMRIYIGLILSECVCIMGGMGVYPALANSQPGRGPTENLEKVQEISSPTFLESIHYDYNTVSSINWYATEFQPTLRDGMKNWNMTVQYWLATCVYQRFPSKNYRTFATMFVSGVWHGVHAGYYISMGMIPFGLIVEDIWAKLLLKDETILSKSKGYAVMLFLKMQFFSYAALAFSLRDVWKILHYYNLVYHWMVPFWLVMYFGGRYLITLKKIEISKGE